MLGAKRPVPKSPRRNVQNIRGAKCPGQKCQGVKGPGPKMSGAKRPGPKRLSPKSPGAKTIPEPSLHDCETFSMIVILHEASL